LIKNGLSEHKHCDNAATNEKRGNSKSIIKASSAGKRGYGDKGRRVWAAGLHDVTARSRLVRVLKLFNRLFLYFSIF
jgi:hypothetical protein